jgi:hypothetical protein
LPDTSKKPKSLPTLAVELKDLVVTYAKQEVVEPLKGLGRFIGAGVAGSILLSLGVVLLVLAVLRVLQDELADTFDGNWSFAPYLITLVLCTIVLALSARAIGAAKRKKASRS